MSKRRRSAAPRRVQPRHRRIRRTRTRRVRGPLRDRRRARAARSDGQLRRGQVNTYTIYSHRYRTPLSDPKSRDQQTALATIRTSIGSRWCVKNRGRRRLLLVHAARCRCTRDYVHARDRGWTDDATGELCASMGPSGSSDGVAVASIGLVLVYLVAGARISGRQAVLRVPGGARHQQARTTSGTRTGANNAAREAFERIANGSSCIDASCVDAVDGAA